MEHNIYYRRIALSLLACIIVINSNFAKTHTKLNTKEKTKREVPKKFTLITSLYNEANQTRCQEYIQCLEKNLANPRIEAIAVFYDTSKDIGNNILLPYLKTRPIRIIPHTGRPTYQTCFTLANEQYLNKNIIIANADIYFNKTLGLLDPYTLTNKFIALTRWNVNSDGSLELFKQYWPPMSNNFRPDISAYSQDSWIFTTPLRPFSRADMALGTMHCDSVIAHYAYESGLQVVNPCHSIQACHVHASSVRNYNPAGPPPGPQRPTPWTTINVLKKTPSLSSSKKPPKKQKSSQNHHKKKRKKKKIKKK